MLKLFQFHKKDAGFVGKASHDLKYNLNNLGCSEINLLLEKKPSFPQRYWEATELPGDFWLCQN